MAVRQMEMESHTFQSYWLMTPCKSTFDDGIYSIEMYRGSGPSSGFTVRDIKVDGQLLVDLARSVLMVSTAV